MASSDAPSALGPADSPRGADSPTAPTGAGADLRGSIGAAAGGAGGLAYQAQQWLREGLSAYAANEGGGQAQQGATGAAAGTAAALDTPTAAGVPSATPAPSDTPLGLPPATPPGRPARRRSTGGLSRVESAPPRAPVSPGLEPVSVPVIPPSATTTPVPAEPSPASASSLPPPTPSPTAPPPAVPTPTAAPTITAPEGEPPPGLPAEFATREWQDRFAVDPLLRTSIVRTLGHQDLSVAQQATIIARHLRRSDARIAEVQTRQVDEDRLWQEQRYSELHAQRDARTTSEAAQRQREVEFTRWLAQVAETNPEDERLLAAGSQGATTEERLAHFADYLFQHTPAAQRAAAALTHTQRGNQQQEIEALAAAHAAELATLRQQARQELEAAVNEARAQTRVAHGPPRLGSGLPAEGSPAPLRFPTAREARDYLSAGIQQLREQDWTSRDSS